MHLPRVPPHRAAWALAGLAAGAVVLGACGTGVVEPATTSGGLPPTHSIAAKAVASTAPRTTAPASTTTTAPATTTTTAPATTTTTLPPLGAASDGLLAGHVTAIGDSVMIDTAPALQADIPGIDVEATVGEQFTSGIGELQQLRAEGRLGSIIVIGLGTNGPFSPSDFAAMMAACQGASRVVFITTHVDQPWQSEVNAALAAGVAQYPKVAVLADWYGLSAAHPEWFYGDGTHMPIGGPGAQALASLVASKVKG